MKKRLFVLSALALFLHATSWAYDFAVANADGVTIYYNILSSEELTMEVRRGYYTGSVDIPETVIYDGNTYTVEGIGKKAFYEERVTDVIIPSTVTYIGDDGFNSCENMTSVSIPESVIEIGKKAFAYCAGLKEITIPYGVTEIKDATFTGCEALEAISIPESVISIGQEAFQYCALTELVIPNSVVEVGYEALYACRNLKTLVLGSSVSVIVSDWCDTCYALEEIYSLNPTPPTGQNGRWDMFPSRIKNSCIVYVPKGCKEAYSTVKVWQDFLHIEEIGEEDAIADITADGEAEASRYTLDGRRVSTPERGVNILRYGDGTAHKVLVK